MTDKAAVKQLRIQALKDAGVVFEAKNNGEHLVIPTLNGSIDFWPSTGKWKPRDSADMGMGLIDLLAYMGAPTAPVVDPRDARIAELEDLLSHAWRIINNEGDVWPDNFSARIEAVLQKPEAHNSESKLPWEV